MTITDYESMRDRLVQLEAENIALKQQLLNQQPTTPDAEEPDHVQPQSP